MYPDVGFPAGTDSATHTLAVSVQGGFESYFKGKPSPLTGEPAEGQPPPESVPGTIETSPASARLIVFGSAEFLDDTVFGISSRMTADRYVNSLKLVQNAVAWSTEDLDLLDIRARGTQARVLDPLAENEQTLWEAANYALALVALVLIGMLWSARRRNEQPLELVPSER
jgi:ABC-2 type transport system permease protein